MSIRYKLILVITAVIILSALPLSMYFLRKQEKAAIDAITAEGETSARILSQSTMNILMMNAGNVNASRIDCKEMIEILRPYMDKGLVHADSILLSSNRALNGMVLAGMRNEKHAAVAPPGPARISETEIEELKARGAP